MVTSLGRSRSLELSNPNRAVFGSLDPPPYLSLADFPQADLCVVELPTPDRAMLLYTGTIDALTEVPEPSFTTLFCIAVIGWLLHTCRRRRASTASEFRLSSM